MIWKNIPFNRVSKTVFIEGNINAKLYVNILRDNLFNSAFKLLLIHIIYGCYITTEKCIENPSTIAEPQFD